MNSKITAENVLSSVDLREWEMFCARWASSAEGFEKYFDLGKNIDRILKTKSAMSLLGSRDNMRILDISAGFCALGMVARHLGHSVTITDVDIPVVRAAQKFLGFTDFREHEYPSRSKYAFVKLPSDIGGFDLITAIACAPMIWWKKPDWAGFFEDCFCHLAPGGSIYILPNRGDGTCELNDLLTHCAYPFEIEKINPLKARSYRLWRQ